MALLDVLLPPRCAGCDRYGSVLCDECLAGLRPMMHGTDRFLRGDAGVVIGETLALAVAAFAHEGTLRRALSRLKYEGMSRVATPIAAAAAPGLASLLDAVGVPELARGSLPLVPIPVHPQRLRERGYNQARLLADALGRASGLQVRELLVRRRPTSRQHGLDRAARLRNLAGAFAATPGARAPPAVVLVDDILTTSATLEACARVLRLAGVTEIYGFAIAREV